MDLIKDLSDFEDLKYRFTMSDSWDIPEVKVYRFEFGEEIRIPLDANFNERLAMLRKMASRSVIITIGLN